MASIISPNLTPAAQQRAGEPGHLGRPAAQGMVAPAADMVSLVVVGLIRRVRGG